MGRPLLQPMRLATIAASSYALLTLAFAGANPLPRVRRLDGTTISPAEIEKTIARLIVGE